MWYKSVMWPLACALSIPASAQSQKDTQAPQAVSTNAQPTETLFYTEHNVWTGQNVSWQVMPSGKGKIIIPDHSFRVGNAAKDVFYTIHKGEHRFDLGPAVYAALRAGFDDIISGEVTEISCAIDISDQPIGMLTWSDKKAATGFRYDHGCQDVEAKVRLAKIADVYRAIALQLNHEKPLILKQ